MEDEKVGLLLHCWVAAPVVAQNRIKGVIFESKSGRLAILAKLVIDATGDGDIFAAAGESYDTDIFEASWHHQMNVAFLWSGVDMERFLQFRNGHPEEFEKLAEQSRDEFKEADTRKFQAGILGMPHLMPRHDVCLFLSPKLEGYNCLDIEDLTAVEKVSRKIMMKMLNFYKSNVPGFENAWAMLTAPQMGVRHSRRLLGTKKMVHSDWKSGIIHVDEIGVSPPPNTKNPNVSIPLGSLIPQTLENLLAAGRNLSCDAVTHNFMRLIPQCWQTGQAAGVAASVALTSGAPIRDVDIAEVQKQLKRQGVYLSPKTDPQTAAPPVRTTRPPEDHRR